MSRAVKCLVLALTAYGGALQAEVKEALYGSAPESAFAAGWPLRVNPPHRLAAFDGRGVKALFLDKPVWLKASKMPQPMPRQGVTFGFLRDPQDLLNRHAIMAMALVKDGKIVFEKYQFGTSHESLFDSQSIAKHLTGLSIGVAVDAGKISSLDTAMATLVPQLSRSPLGGATVRQTLQMQCGHAFKWEDDGGPESSAALYAQARYAVAGKGGRNLYSYYEGLKGNTPGQVFTYDPHCTDSLSMLVTQLSGQPLRQYFEDNIWQKLQPTHPAVWLSPSQHPELTTGASSFYASLGDYALLAQMVIDGGRLHGQTILSGNWIRRMTQDTVPVAKSENENFKRYGYQTWVRTDESGSWFAGLGNHGQRFYIDPKNRSAMLIFALDFDHIKDSDKFWEWFRKIPADKL